WLIPGWQDILGCPVPERIEKLRSPEIRARMSEGARSDQAGVLKMLAHWGRYVLGDVYAPENEPLRGRAVGDIAAERGQDAFDTLLDIVVADELRTILWPVPREDERTWEARRNVWEDPRAMLGGSDAGAHLDRMCG